MGGGRRKRKLNRKRRPKKGKIREQVDEREMGKVEKDMERIMRRKGEIGR
jgi:hypothetical protein